MRKPGTNDNAFLFFSGAEMWPTDLLAAHPEGRFVARARVINGGAPVAESLRSHLEPEIWGIVVETPGSGPDSPEVEVVTDDGRSITARAGTAELVSGEHEDVLRAARYWELPPPYIGRLRIALAAVGVEVVDEEPRDDGALG